MTFADKYLYHQIHPFKLAADIGSCVVSCVLLWQQQLLWAMVWAFAPAVLASALVLTLADLGRYQASGFGRYVRAHMNRPVEAQRLTGQVIMWLGAWHHLPALLGLGAAVIVLAWLGSVGRPRSLPDQRHP